MQWRPWLDNGWDQTGREVLEVIVGVSGTVGPIADQIAISSLRPFCSAKWDAGTKDKTRRVIGQQKKRIRGN